MFRHNPPGPSCARLPWALRVLEALKETALGYEEGCIVAHLVGSVCLKPAT